MKLILLIVCIVVAWPMSASAQYTLPMNPADYTISSWFDHTSPQYDGDSSSTMTKYDGTTNASYNGHNGIDYATGGQQNKPVLAAADGVVKNVQWQNPNDHTQGYGFYVRIYHGNYGDSTLYGHLNSSGVAVDSTVMRGAQVGASGNTGASTGPHLHFSVFRGDTSAVNSSIDPYGWSGSGSDPWTANRGYLWSTNPPSMNPAPSDIATPDVGYNEDGRMVVGMRGSANQVFVAEQTSANGNWGGWTELTGETLGGNLKFGRNLDKRVEFFGNKNYPGTTPQSIRARWQTSVNGAFNGPSSNSFLDLQGMMTSDPSVSSNQNGAIQFFVVHNDGSVYSKYQNQPNGATGYSGWVGLGGSGVLPKIGSVQAYGGGQYVAVLGGDGVIYYRRQTIPNNNSSWTGWLNFGGNGIVGKPVLTKDAAGRLRIFVRGGDNKIYHQWETSAGSNSFSGWYPVAVTSTSASNPAVAVYGGQTYVFLRGTDNSIWYTRETSLNTWSTWETMNANAVTSDPAVGVNQSGLLTVFARGGDGVLYQKKQTGTSTWDTWAHIGDLLSRF